MSVNHQMCIICTIHQPNNELFQMFDNIYVLSKGGHHLYWGSPQDLNHYLRDSGVEINESDVPIEVILKFATLGITNTKTRLMNEKCSEKRKVFSEVK